MRKKITLILASIVLLNACFDGKDFEVSGVYTLNEGISSAISCVNKDILVDLLENPQGDKATGLMEMGYCKFVPNQFNVVKGVRYQSKYGPRQFAVIETPEIKDASSDSRYVLFDVITPVQ